VTTRSSAPITGEAALEAINPKDLPPPLGYTHVIVATGSRLVFVAGQEPEDEQANLVGPGDLAVQARQVFANLGALSLLPVLGLSR
jgi:enamine deaminase RidA (YjgF/YER057c/UK114 family)